MTKKSQKPRYYISKIKWESSYLLIDRNVRSGKPGHIAHPKTFDNRADAKAALQDLLDRA